MTTTVKVTHQGPDHHDVRVAVLTHPDGVQVTSTQLAAGESCEFHVYDTQRLAVSEVPKRPASALAARAEKLTKGTQNPTQ